MSILPPVEGLRSRRRGARGISSHIVNLRSKIGILQPGGVRVGVGVGVGGGWHRFEGIIDTFYIWLVDPPPISSLLYCT